MKSLSGKDLAKLLEQRGWVLRRVHGSHHIYMKPDSEVRLSVPIHANQSLKDRAPPASPEDGRDLRRRDLTMGLSVRSSRRLRRGKPVCHFPLAIQPQQSASLQAVLAAILAATAALGETGRKSRNRDL